MSLVDVMYCSFHFSACIRLEKLHSRWAPSHSFGPIASCSVGMLLAIQIEAIATFLFNLGVYMNI